MARQDFTFFLCMDCGNLQQTEYVPERFEYCCPNCNSTSDVFHLVSEPEVTTSEQAMAFLFKKCLREAAMATKIVKLLEPKFADKFVAPKPVVREHISDMTYEEIVSDSNALDEMALKAVFQANGWLTRSFRLKAANVNDLVMFQQLDKIYNDRVEALRQVAGILHKLVERTVNL